MTDVHDVGNPTLPVLVTFIFNYVVSEAFVDVLQVRSKLSSMLLRRCELNKQEGQLARMLALEIKQADRVVQEEEAKTQVAKAEAMRKARAADKNARRGITVPSGHDDVAEELDATWLQAGGNGNPMKRAFKHFWHERCYHAHTPSGGAQYGSCGQGRCQREGSSVQNCSLSSKLDVRLYRIH